MGNRSTLSVTLSVLAISVLLGTASSNAYSSYAGSTSNTAVVSWLPPAERTDGSALTNLSGYRVHYGKSMNAMRIIDIRNPGQTSQFIDGLGEGWWFFAVTAYTSDGLESEMSGLGAKRILEQGLIPSPPKLFWSSRRGPIF
jgi:hypothetical protein